MILSFSTAHWVTGNQIKSAFDNSMEPYLVEKTVKQFVNLGILSFTETDKVAYAAA